MNEDEKIQKNKTALKKSKALNRGSDKLTKQQNSSNQSNVLVPFDIHNPAGQQKWQEN